jgi:hypothetical protein
MVQVDTYDGDGRIWLNVVVLQVRVELARMYRRAREQGCGAIAQACCATRQ